MELWEMMMVSLAESLCNWGYISLFFLSALEHGGIPSRHADCYDLISDGLCMS